jgi:hypothetical protein
MATFLQCFVDGHCVWLQGPGCGARGILQLLDGFSVLGLGILAMRSSWEVTFEVDEIKPVWRAG